VQQAIIRIPNLLLLRQRSCAAAGSENKYCRIQKTPERSSHELDPQRKLLRSSQQSSGRSESLRKKKWGEVENCNDTGGFYASPNGGGPVSVGERTFTVDSNSTGIIVRLDVSWMFSFHKDVNCIHTLKGFKFGAFRSIL
jgi:hypothetical protein